MHLFKNPNTGESFHMEISDAEEIASRTTEFFFMIETNPTARSIATRAITKGKLHEFYHDFLHQVQQDEDTEPAYCQAMTNLTEKLDIVTDALDQDVEVTELDMAEIDKVEQVVNGWSTPGYL